jgi:hypothetical protein
MLVHSFWEAEYNHEKPVTVAGLRAEMIRNIPETK